MRYKVNIFVYLFHLKNKKYGNKKTIRFDTNVILHDYKCIYNFEENDIYLPLVVFEELDDSKKGMTKSILNARQFIRSRRFDG